MSRLIVSVLLVVMLAVSAAATPGPGPGEPFGGDDGGCVPHDRGERQCGDKLGKAIARLIADVSKCHVKQADARFSTVRAVRGDRSMLRASMRAGLALLVLRAVPLPAHARVSVNLDFNLGAPPALVAIPGTPVLYAPSVPANYFFYGGRYYVFANGVWYTSLPATTDVG